MTNATTTALSKGASEGARTNPHFVLLLVVVVVLVLETLRGSATVGTSPVWPIVQAAVAAAAFVIVWQHQERLRLAPLLVIGLAFHLAWIGLHLMLGVQSDADSIHAYPEAGDALLSGTYPSSEYPPGAVVLFALDSLISGGGRAVRVSHAFVMVPFQLATVVAVWALRTRWSKWFAAVVALWPLNAFFWEFKFDAAPTAALAFGLLFATRRRWSLTGIALGVGAALKWTPALSGLVLAAWLLGRGRAKAALAQLSALVATFVLINLPFIVRWPDAVLDSYRYQGGRGITAESLFYLPLRFFGIVRFPGNISHEAGAPAWANGLAIAVQMIVLLAILGLATRVRRLRAGVSLAAMAPAAFLLTNRIFSPQFLVMFVAVWAVAGALLAQDSGDQLRLGFIVFGATLVNVLIYPTYVHLFSEFSAVLFLFSFVATGWVLVRVKARTLGATRRAPADRTV